MGPSDKPVPFSRKGEDSTRGEHGELSNVVTHKRFKHMTEFDSKETIHMLEIKPTGK